MVDFVRSEPSQPKRNKPRTAHYDFDLDDEFDVAVATFVAVDLAKRKTHARLIQKGSRLRVIVVCKTPSDFRAYINELFLDLYRHVSSFKDD